MKNINYTITGNIFIIFDMNVKNFIVIVCTKEQKLDEKVIVNISIDENSQTRFICNYYTWR